MKKASLNHILEFLPLHPLHPYSPYCVVLVMLDAGERSYIELIPKLKISSPNIEFGTITGPSDNEHIYELLIDVEIKLVLG